MIRDPRRSLARYSVLLALLAGTVYLVTDYLWLPWVVIGRSMEPALQHGDRIVVDLWTYAQRAPRTGEVVLFSGPLPERAVLLKRVAVEPPGGRPQGRSEIWGADADLAGGTVWVRGDHPAVSVDSRSFGPVPRNRMRGRAVFRYWPPSRIGPIR